ncbi:MAG: M1 family metallopeptidase [Proteobacteria bacterium]|nr:M1 family metallopeptidase [Pseudomonadota bacterium]
MIRLITAAFALALAPYVLAAPSGAPEGRLPDTVTPSHYRLALTIDPRKDQFEGATTIDIDLHAATSVIWLHGLGLKVKTATIEANSHTITAKYEEVDHDTGVAKLTAAAPVPAGQAVLKIEYSAPFQDSPQGLYRNKIGDDWYAFTQFEAIDARRAFPSFDEPRFKTPFDVTITTHGGDLAVTNGAEVKAQKSPGAQVWTFQTTRPLPTYLVAFAVGPLQVVEGVVPPNAVRHTPLPLRVIGPKGDPKRYQFALEQSPELIRRLESYFGIAFPYPKIDLIASPHHTGAMENAGAIIFEEDLIAFEHPPTPREEINFGTVTAHELAHQWFGDLVTPAWWDDIWLNESFAEWMGSKIADEWRPKLGIEQEQLDGTLQAMNTDALRAGRPIHQPVETNLGISSTFDDITYQKGAGVIGMVESYLGTERFQKGVRLHLTRHAYGTATAAEFFRAMAEGSGDPAVIEAFESFVNQPGVPLVSVARAADGSLKLTQSRYRPLGPGADGTALTWKIPFCASFYPAAGSPAKQCTMLATPTGTLAVPAALKGATVHPNAQGAGYYRFAVDADLWHALLTRSAQLPPRESVTLADSASAALDAGKLSFAGFYEAAQALAAHPDRTTALSLGYRLDTLHDRLATPAEQPLIEHALVSLYGPRLARLGYDASPGRYASDPPEQQLLRRQLIGLVALSGRDPAVRAALVPFAEHSLNDPTRVEPLFRWRVWAVGIQERGAAVFGPLKALSVGRDAQVRTDAGIAVGYTEGPALVKQALDFSLDPQLDPGSAGRIVFLAVGNPRTREVAWKWLDAHEAAAVGRLPVMFQAAAFASLGNSFCSAAERASFETVLGNKLKPLNGGDIAVGRALESIDDCIALRASLGDSITRTLKAAH